MTAKANTSRADGLTARQLDIQRIAVNKQGYDRTGAYWGAGLDVFIGTSAAGAEEVTVRARNLTQARSKMAAELSRQPGEVRPDDRDHIGGASPHKSRYEIEWRNPVTSDVVRIRITHARDYLSSGNDHVEVESIKPKKAPLPITETGYRSHFMAPLDLINAGGPVAFVAAWIEQEAKGKAWSKAVTVKAQGDLFSWAEAKSEVGPRQRPAKPKAPVARVAKKRSPDRTPE
jgi:hypothetical protein